VNSLVARAWFALVPLAATCPFLIWRLFDEESLLAETLPGYVDYRKKVRHRLVPGIW
jgi:protein-S-isoprenylcysteine O-methyltransferase Ste14